ncbi:MAG: TolC family protein, partial [Betaproteobacteria bacterium]|nr:TolC family protein [Betaproteobacteria bacterium]
AERSALERMPDPTVALRYANERSGEDRIFGVGISIPLPGEARRAGYAGALAQLDQARQEEIRIRNKIEREARQLLAQVIAAKNIAATQAQIRDQAQSNAALVMKAYTLGESAFADTLLASRQALEATQAAETAHLDALELHARFLLDTHRIWSLEDGRE